MSADTFALLAGVTVASMAMHSVMGFGFAQILGPVLLAIRPAAETVVALLTMAVLINALVALDGRPQGAARALVAPLLPGAAVGSPLGALLLISVDKSWLQLLSGAAIVVAAGLQMSAGRRQAAAARPPVGRPLTLLAGALSGALTTATAIGAAPAILWIERMRPSKECMRWSIAAYSLVLCVAGVALLVVGARDAATSGLALAAAMTPFVAVGYVCGRRVFRRVDAGHYRIAALGLVTASGVATVLAGAV